MSAPTLEDLKRHMRIRHDQEDDDLQLKLDAAIDAASQYLNRPIPWLDPDQLEVVPPVYLPVPKSVFAAILIMAADLCANREQSIVGASYVALPTATNLLVPFRLGLGV